MSTLTFEIPPWHQIVKLQGSGCGIEDLDGAGATPEWKVEGCESEAVS